MSIAFAIPGDLSLPTGGYAYDRRVLAEWDRMGIACRHLALPGSFPSPTEADLDTTREILTATAGPLLVDGLAFGALPEAFVAALPHPLIALVHHPLALEAGLSPARAAQLRASEMAALRHTDAVVVTSPATKALLVADFGVAAGKVTVAEPGTDPAPRAEGSAAGKPLSLLAVGAVIPRKGYDVLVAALADLADRAWHLTIIGALDRAPDTVDALRRQITEAGLDGRISLAGAVSDARLAEAYAGADLFVMPSLFEGYGMVLTEALARGLPILCTTGGAAAETAPDEAALKVLPGNVAALRQGLGVLIDDGVARKARADAAWRAAGSLSRWQEAAIRVAAACGADVLRKVS